MAKRVDVSVCELSDKIKLVMQKVGLSQEDAAVVANSLIDAEISGVESHGITRLKPYVDRILQGNITAVPELVITQCGSTLSVNGGNGLGQVVMNSAVELCLQSAKANGIAAVTASHSNHFGTAAYFANKIAKQGCIGFVATNAGSTMAPFGGMDLLLGTNPFAIAFPAKEQIFCADMATSAVAKGKIRIYEKEGKEIPFGWALDHAGRDTHDPKEAINGILLPMGGHKGYALAMAVDAICGLLSGANLSCEAPSMFNTEIPANTGHFVCAVDIAHFLPLDEFETRAQGWFDRLKESNPREGMRVMIPGEPEAQKRAEAGERISVLAESLEMVETYFDRFSKIENKL